MTNRLVRSMLVLMMVTAIAMLVIPALAQDGGAQIDENDTEIEARNKALVYQLYEETNAGNGQFFVDLLAEDYEDHSFPGGKEAFLAVYQTFFTAFPDLQFEVTHVLADGDLVAVRGIQTATHLGNFMGIVEPTNKEVAWTGTAVFRFNEEGLIVERWQDLDQLGLFTQLGVIPSFGPTSG